MTKLLALALSLLPYTGHNIQNKVNNRKVIVVIDTGITLGLARKPYMCVGNSALSADFRSGTHPLKRHTHYTLHGTNVVGLIGERINTKKYCIVSILAFRQGRANNMYYYQRALKMASSIPGVVAVNLSINSAYIPGIDQYSKEEHATIESMTNHGIRVNIAAGNQGIKLVRNPCQVYPACLKFRIRNPDMINIIGSARIPCDTKNCDEERYKSSNWSSSIDIVYENGHDVGQPPMSGTSQATALYTGRLFSK